MKQETTFVLTHNELDDLIQVNLGLENYECIADEEWSNSESHVFDISLEDYTPSDRATTAQVLQSGDTMFKTRYLLSELADRGIIPWGIYRIDVWW